MGVHLKLVNFDQLIERCTQVPVILNDVNEVTEKDKTFLRRLTTTVYDNVDVFSNEPACECGKVRGGYNLKVVCTECLTPVMEPFSQELENRVWIRSPKGVEPLINPIVWRMLSRRFTKSKFNLLEWLCNTDYSVPTDPLAREIEEIRAAGLERGYNYFVRNFDKVLEVLMGLKSFTRRKDEQLRALVRMERPSFFSRHLPLLNKALLILENTPSGRFMDSTVSQILDAIKTITAIDTEIADFTQRQRENRTIKTIVKMSDYYFTAYKEQLAGKQGIIRKNVFGTRLHFSSRAVISSTTDPHKYDELHIAWGHGITMLRLHLMNKLMRQHYYTPNEATALLQEYTVKFHPLLKQLMQEIIDESPDKGLWCIFERNPSLSRASTQAMKVTKVKDDPLDPTISLSILAVRGFNADFDGDQMSLMLMLDNRQSAAIQALAPHKNMFDANRPRQLTDNAAIPKPVASTICSWISAERVSSGDPAKRAFLEALAV